MGVTLSIREKPELTASELKKELRYDADSGAFYWVNKKPGRPSYPNRAGTIQAKRRKIGINGVGYQTSRLAFLYMEGKWPSLTIQHTDGCLLNDRWDNLREGPLSGEKRVYLAISPSGSLKGVQWLAKVKNPDGTVANLGKFPSIRRAVRARKQYKIKRQKEISREPKRLDTP